MSRLELLLEAERRGLLPPDKRALLQEARQRGLVPSLEEEEPEVPVEAAEPERTFGGYAKEAFKGLIPGAAGLAETAITGAAALLPEEAEQAVRERVSGAAESVREAFAPAPGYEDTAVRKVSEAVGSTIPFLPLGALGAAGKLAARGLGVATGVGTAREMAEEAGATEGERGLASALGAIPGYLESLPPLRILRRLGFGDEALTEIAKASPALVRIAKAGGEEALQEASSQVLQNLIAKGVYAPDEAVFGGVGEAAALGGGAGAIVSAIADLALGRRLRGRGEGEPTEERPEEPGEEEIKALPAPRMAGYKVDSEGNVVPMTEAEAEEGAKLNSQFRALGLGEAEALARRMQDQREKQFIEGSEAALRKAALDEDAAAAAKDDMRYLRSLPMEQMGLGLEGGEAAPETVLPPAAEPRPQMFVSGEEALAKAIEQRELETGEEVRPRSRAYREEAKDLGVRLDRKGEVKPNQAVFEQPEALKYELIYTDKTGNKVAQTFDTVEQQREAYDQVLASGIPEENVVRKREAASIEQFALDLPGIPMDRLAPRDRVLRAMSITEDKKNIPNLQFATQLRPMELQKTIGDLKKEGAIAFNKKANEWELTPAGAENVRTGSPETKPAGRRRSTGMSVSRQKAAAPSVVEAGEPRVVSAGEPAARSDVGEGPSVPPLETTAPEPITAAAPAAPTPPVDRMALIRRAAEQRAARTAIDDTTQRRTALRTQAIDAFDADEISEKTYTAVTEELKKPVPNFARVTSMLEGTAKPKRQGVGLKFQRGEEPRKTPVYRIVNIRTGQVVGTANTLKGARLAMDRRDTQYGGYAHKIEVIDPEADIAQRQKLRTELGAEPLQTPVARSTTFQRGEAPATPQVAPEQAQAIAADTARDWANPPTIVVARNIDDPAIAQFRDQIPDDAKGFYTNGTTYVLADRAPDESSIRGTVLHESLGHYGLEQEFGAGLQSEMQGIYNTNKGVQRLANERMAKDKSLDAATAVEEVLAERSESGPIKEPFLRSALNRLIAYVRNYLRKKGFVSQYSDNDITQMLRRAHERVTTRKKAPYDPFNPQIRYQRSPAEQRKGDRAFINAIGKIPSSLPEATKSTYDTAANVASRVGPPLRKALYSMVNAHDLDRMYGNVTKGFGKLWKYLNQEGVALRDRQDQIVNNIQDWQKVLDKYTPAQRDRFYKVMMDTTVEQVEVLDMVDPSRNINWAAKKDSPLYNQFKQLPKEVQDVYKQLRLAYIDYSLGVEKILQQYVTPNEWQKMLNKFNERRLQVYLPLFRTGKYKLRYIDKDGEAVALQFDSPRERRMALDAAKRAGATDEQLSTVGERDVQLPSTGFFGDVVASLTKAKVKPEVIQSIVETYLDYLPAKSVLQLARKRTGVAGFSNNVLEAYANVGGSYARRLTNMEYAPKFREAQEEIETDLKTKAGTPELSATTAEDLLETVAKQMDFIANPNLDNWAAKASYFSYQMYLGANISTAIVNTFDIPTITWSRLGGKHGFGKAFNSLLKAGTVFFSKKKSPEMEQLLRRGLESGALREQQLRDIAEFKDLDSKYERIKAGTERITNWAFAKSDMFNRQVAFAAAYDLNKKTPEGVFDENAFEQAQRAVYDVYGSSFPKAAPPIMGNGFARTALTFKRFALVRMWLLTNAFREAAKGESKEVRDAARKEILGYFGAAYVFAGVQGMPVVGALSALASALNAALGDDDEPYNPDFEIRDAIGLFNYKGPVNYLTGVDIASRTGWTGMFWREDPKRMAEVGPVTYTMEQLLGPAYSYAVGVPKAFNYMAEENYQRAFEQLAPKAVGNIAKGMRYAAEGALTPSGKPLVDDVDAYNVFMQIFGFRPSDVAEAGETAGAITRMQRSVLERRNSIIGRAALARLSGDYEGFQKAIEEAQAFSAKFPERAITAETLIGAVQRRQKALAQSVYGITVDQKLSRRIYDELGLEE